MTRSTKVLLAALVWYRGARWHPSACRFVPSCSLYAEEALERHGTFRGSWLAVRRLARCHPLGPHGFDPVPEPRSRGGELRS